MKKVITLILALCMVLCMFVACKPSEQKPGESTPAPGGSTPAPGESTPAEEEVNPYEEIGLPDGLNYGNNEFTIVHWNEVRPEFYVEAEDQDGDPVADAIFKRNLYTEDLLGIEFNFIHNKYETNTVASMNAWCDRLNNIMSDPSTPVDIFASYSRILSTATVRGLNQDVAVYENLDLDKTWWPSAIIDELSIDGKLFIITGDLSTNVLYNMYAIFYNKTMAEAYGIPDLIEIVENDEWTIDKMIEVTSVGYQDMTADGKTDDDQFGMTFDWYCADAIIQGADFKILESTDEDGKYVKLSDDFYSETFDAFISKMANWAKTTSIFDDPDYGGEAGTSFYEGRSIFHLTSVAAGFTLQETDIDYAILPLPIRDKDQTTGYRTCLANSYTNYGMARGCRDGERAAAVFATLGYYGNMYTTPAIFDVTFKGKFSKDPAMMDMFDTIRNGVCFDMGLLYMRELNSINDRPTEAIRDNTDWLGVKMNAFSRKALNDLLGKFNNKIDAIMNA